MEPSVEKKKKIDLSKVPIQDIWIRVIIRHDGAHEVIDIPLAQLKNLLR